MSSHLIVEGETDKFFIEALLAHLDKNAEVELEPPICFDGQCEDIGGMSKLEKSLIAVKRNIENKDDRIDKVGIIFDANSIGVAVREKEIQEIIDSVFGAGSKIECPVYIINIEGQGELETVLKVIKSKDSTHADCIDSFQDCLSNGEKLNQKELDKRWVDYYQRYDCCKTRKERKLKSKYCSHEASMKKGIYDFDNDVLNDLKDFLNNL